jgi:hypothetical protein
MNSAGPGGVDFMQMMQSQIITMTSMKNGDMFSAIMGIMLLTMFNKIIKFVPVVTLYVTEFVKKRYMKKMENNYTYNKLKTLSSGIKKERTGTIRFDKNDKTNPDNIILLAVINHISNLKSSKFVVYNFEYFVANTEEFLIKPDIFCKVLQFSKDSETQKIKTYEFEIYSYLYDIDKLKLFIETLVDEYTQEKSNNLGKQPYYFSEMFVDIPKNIDGTYRYEQSPKHITFDMTQFHTNKSLKNVFGSHLDIVKKRVDMFVNNPSWYEDKGIPYTLGIMLSGPPGTGKTSLIKAIAKDTTRHIFNISLRETTTQTQLKKLFYNTKINILRNGGNEMIDIPLEKRLYVIEDIDCLTDIVIDRDLLNNRKFNSSSSLDTFDDTLVPNNVNLLNKDKKDEKNDKVQKDTILPSNDFNSNFGNYSLTETTDNLLGEPTDMGSALDNMYGLPLVNKIRQTSDNSAESCQETSQKMEQERNNKVKEELNTIAFRKSSQEIEKQINDMDKEEKVVTEQQKAYNRYTKGKENGDNKQQSVNTEKITLSFLLNLLDGILETPGRILIITTNHPELLDPALIRPGRIDIKLKVGNCTQTMIIDMLRFFYGDDVDITENDWTYNKEITPAYMNKLLLNNFDNYDNCKKDVILETQ